MYLSKYPVKTEHGTYTVSVFDSYVTLGMYQLKAVVRLEVKRRLTFGFLKPTKLKKVHEIASGWDGFREWTGLYIEFAKQAIDTYEEKKLEKFRLEDLKEQGIKDFKEWDGVIK